MSTPTTSVVLEFAPPRKPAPICHADYAVPGSYVTGKAGKVPGTNVRLLTNTSKMPSKSWSLPAGKSCPAAVYGPGTICGSCYAAKGAYKWSSTVNAQTKRFEWAVRCMRTPEGRQAFIDEMVQRIGGTRKAYFRVHDAGDMFSPAYVRCWTAIARALPGKRFWVPTRTWQFLDRPLWREPLLELSALPNVTMRPSALRFGDAPPIIPGMAAGTTATTAGYSCPAPQQGNACGDCRVCWDEPDVAVSYHKH